MNKAYEFCERVINEETTPKYVRLQMDEFMRTCRGENPKYIVSEKKVRQVENCLKILNMPKGLKAGQPLYNCTCGYQWLFYIAILCTVYRSNEEKRRYETGILEICRKNFKTYTIATIFILLFLTEPKFSKFYSVAPDGSLSREIKAAIAETIRSSPLVYEYKGRKRFAILRDYIRFNPSNTQYTPLSYSTSRMDGKLPNAFCADEVGALPVSYPIEAMRSGQLNILNKLGFIISTKYPTIDNPFEDEVAYAKKVLDGIEKDSPSSVTPLDRSGIVNSVSVVSYGSYFAENVFSPFALPRMVLSMNQPTQRSRIFSRASLSFRPVLPTCGSFALSPFTT